MIQVSSFSNVFSLQKRGRCKEQSDRLQQVREVGASSKCPPSVTLFLHKLDNDAENKVPVFSKSLEVGALLQVSSFSNAFSSQTGQRCRDPSVLLQQTEVGAKSRSAKRLVQQNMSKKQVQSECLQHRVFFRNLRTRRSTKCPSSGNVKSATSKVQSDFLSNMSSKQSSKRPSSATEQVTASQSLFLPKSNPVCPAEEVRLLLGRFKTAKLLV